MRPSERERISIFCQTLERQWGSGQWPDRQAVRRKQAPTPRKQKEEKSDLRHNFSNTSPLYIFPLGSNFLATADKKQEVC